MRVSNGSYRVIFCLLVILLVFVHMPSKRGRVRSFCKRDGLFLKNTRFCVLAKTFAICYNQVAARLAFHRVSCSLLAGLLNVKTLPGGTRHVPS